MRSAIVLGAGGFIGGHLVKRLKAEGAWVRGVDLKRPEFGPTAADEFLLGDLRDPTFCAEALAREPDEIFQLAADMGGAGFVFTGAHDADIMHNSAAINLNVLGVARDRRYRSRIFYSSSACIYPEYNQMDPDNPRCAETDAYPAAPDSEYGWEKLFSERLYAAFARNYGLNCRVARYHNIFGPEGTWTGGREKAPAAICRKVAEAPNGGEIEVWGDGRQTRSFLYVDECVEGTLRLARSDVLEPLNIGSDEMVSINDLVALVAEIAGKRIEVRHIDGPQGVRGRNSDNNLIADRLGWAPSAKLRSGLERTYEWVKEQVESATS